MTDNKIKNNYNKANHQNSQKHAAIWFEICTKQMFQNFQRSIYPIVQNITSQQEHMHHAFTKQWLHMNTKCNITEHTTFASLKRHFAFDDIISYATFLQQCPQIDRYVIIRPAKRSKHAIEFGLVPPDGQSTQEPITQESDIWQDYIINVIITNKKSDSLEIKELFK